MKNIEGQMSIFDFLKPASEVKVYYKVDELYVWKTVHCSECVNANINVNDEKFCKYTECSKNGYINFESKEKTICQFSKHECNKENLWKVADSLDGIECERKCCRLCEMWMLCGARCNGADNLSICNENCEECGKYTTSRTSYDGKNEIYSCFYAGKTVIKRIPCNRVCDVEWCSIACFERRGLLYDRVKREWIKGKDGKPLRKSKDKVECDWEPKEPEEIHFNRKGEKVEVPKWLKGKKRCELCKYWQILNEELQPADGWGIEGSCTSHRGQGRSTQATSYCDDYEYGSSHHE